MPGAQQPQAHGNRNVTDSPILKLLCALSIPYTYVYATKRMFAEDFEIERQASSKLDADLHDKHIELTKSPKWFERTIDAVLNGNDTPWPSDDGSLRLLRKRACSPSPARSNGEHISKCCC